MGMNVGRWSTLGLVAAGMGLAAGKTAKNVTAGSWDFASDVLLGNAQADQSLMGMDLGWGNYLSPIQGPYAGAAAGGLGGGFLGTALGGAAGYGLRHFGKLGTKGMVGLALGGGMLGSMMGAAHGSVSEMMPYINSTTMKGAFSPDKQERKAWSAAAQNRKKGYNDTNMPNSIYPYGASVTYQGAAGDSDYYANDFPGPTTRARSYTTGATGDIVLGAYNLRMR